MMACLLVGRLALGQAAPTMSRPVELSAFGGVSGVETGLSGGRNLSVTAGLDLGLRKAWDLRPSLEYRARYAMDQGTVDGIKNQMGGLKVAWQIAGLKPYADVLYGRGEITYLNGGYQVPGKFVYYTASSSNVFAGGGGVDFGLGYGLAVKVDAQMEVYQSKVALGGHFDAAVGTVGLVYVFDLGRRR